MHVKTAAYGYSSIPLFFCCACVLYTIYFFILIIYISRIHFSGAIELLFKSFLGENPTKLDSRLQGSLVGIIEFTAASFDGVGIIPRTDSFKAKYIRFIIDGSICIACDRECYNRDNII